MAIALEQFVKQLEESGVLAPGKLEHFIPPNAHPTTAEELARELIKKNQLTKFQAQHVLQGKAKALFLGNYTILDKIGAGGMGQVFKAKHRRMDRIVAIKMLPHAVTTDPVAVARFEREVKAAARLRHPNIVAADDADEANGVNFLVMEYVDGKDLSAMVKRDGAFPVARAVDCILQAARGLDYAHKNGVIHRDIKPANLLLNAAETIKILDMGLARIVQADAEAQAELTGTGAMMGTVDYMAPEQALGTHHADARADIYSLGCTLYYLISGKATYGGDSAVAKLLAHRETPIPSLRLANRHVPEQLEAIFRKMVAKKTEDRFQTMSEVVTELERCRVARGSTSTGTKHSLDGTGENPELTFLRDMPSEAGHRLPAAAKAKEAKPPKPPRKERPAPAATAGRGSKLKRPLVIAGGALAGVAILAAIVLFSLRTETGTLVVEVNQPDASVQVLDANGTVEMSRPAGKGTVSISVDPGRHRLKVAKDGFQFFSQDFALESGGQLSIKARLEPLKVLTPVELLESADYGWTEPENLGPKINGTESDGFPSLTADGLSLVYMKIMSENQRKLAECRRSAADQDWGKPTLSAPPITYEPFLSADGLTLVGASWSNRLSKNQLQMSRRASRDAVWGAATDPGPAVDVAGDGRRPSLSADGLTLLFGSDRAGGFGGRDLWISRRNSQDAPFGPATNVGRHVNTEGNEDPGRILADGETILFQRDGGYYLTYKNLAGFRGATRLADLPEPSDGLWLSPDGRTLYFHATRPGGFGQSDLWVTRRVLRSQIPASPTTPVVTDRGPITTFKEPAFQQWVRGVAALPAEQQVTAVAKKLQELNPGFDGKVTGLEAKGTPRIESGVVTELGFVTENVTDLSPIRALTGLRILACNGGGFTNRSPLSDLSPLQGLKLVGLDCSYTQISELSPLQGMPLTKLYCSGTKVANLSPLHEMKLTALYCSGSAVADLSPLQGMPLTALSCQGTPVSNLSPLASISTLSSLNAKATKVTALGVDTLQKALPNCKIEWEDPAKSITTFKDPAFQQWMNTVTALSAEEQVEAVVKKLQELNPGFDGKVTHRIEQGIVTEFFFLSDAVTDLSPVRVMTGLKSLYCNASIGTKSELYDLSPLRGLLLTKLNCGGSIVSDLSPLQGMMLTTLDCYTSNISSLAPLKQQTTLTKLNCNNTRISDLSPLDDCKQLASLRIRNTKITPAGVAALQKAFPNCQVEWDDPAQPNAPGVR